MNPVIYQQPPHRAMDFFRSLPESTTRIQLIKNLIVMEPAPVFIHQDTLAGINHEIYAFVRKRSLGKVLFAPIDVYLNDGNAFQLDILFVSSPRLHIIKKDGIYGAPDLVIEILSPSTAKYDRHDKKQVYEQCGVKEYWLVDPETRLVEGFRLLNGAFKTLPSTNAVIHSALLRATFRF